MMYRALFMLTITCALLSTCSRNTTSALVGQWRGTDDAGNEIRIAFTQQGEYHLFVNQTPLISSDNQPLKYQLSPQADYVEVLLFEQPSDLEQNRISRLQASFINKREVLLVPDEKERTTEGIQLTRL